MTQEELRKLRVTVAAYIAKGNSISAAAAKFKRSIDYVYKACRANAVDWERWRRQHVNVDPFEVLASLREGKTLQAVGDSIGLSRERVRQIKARAIKYGVLDWKDRRKPAKPARKYGLARDELRGAKRKARREE